MRPLREACSLVPPLAQSTRLRLCAFANAVGEGPFGEHWRRTPLGNAADSPPRAGAWRSRRTGGDRAPYLVGKTGLLAFTPTPGRFRFALRLSMGRSKPEMPWRRLCRTGSEAASSGQCAWLACCHVADSPYAWLRRTHAWMALDVDNRLRAVPRREADHDPE